MTLQNIYSVGETGIGAARDDLTKMAYVEAVVNADGAADGCGTGKAKITDACGLPCKRMIHTVCPVWQGGDSGEAELLASCYTSSLQTAVDNGIRTIAFPSISTGASSYPLEEAAYIAVHAVIGFVAAHPGELAIVLWACTDDRTQAAYQRALEQAASEQDFEMHPGMMVVASELEVGKAVKEMFVGAEDDAPPAYLS